MTETKSNGAPTVRGLIMKIDKTARSRKQVPHVYCPGQSKDYPIKRCKEYCRPYYGGIVMGGMVCCYHEPAVYHLELKSDPSTGKLSLTLVR